MKIGALKEREENERRVAMTPDSIPHLIKLGHECAVERGAGLASGFDDDSYKKAGATVLAGAGAVWKKSDVIVKVRPLGGGEFGKLEKSAADLAGKTLIGFARPHENADLLKRLGVAGVDLLAMDRVPRISRAQKMDALSSMANIAGYRGVIEAAGAYERFFAGQITAAGRIPPARVLVIGAGVAGLSAIAAAKALGAAVRAFDVRREAAGQIESMGAEFVALDFDEDASGQGGYAAPSSPEFRAAQLARFRELAPEMDIVVTAALIPGQDAPKLWLDDMVAAMKPGSAIVDLAAESGGNCTMTQIDRKIATDRGVVIIGFADLPSRMAAQASTLYAANVRHLIADLTPNKDGRIVLNMEDDVIRGTAVLHRGRLLDPPAPPKAPAVAPSETKKTKETPTQPEKPRIAPQQAALVGLIGGAALLMIVGAYAPADFMRHLIVFTLAVFVGFQVVWNVAHALHTPLMSITNAISGIIVIGALLQINDPDPIVKTLAAIASLIAAVNVVGGFMVTRRMLRMFQKS